MGPERAQAADSGRPGRPGWYTVVPLKPLRLAKSRLAQAAGEPGRGELALAFALDTVSAALECPQVRSVVVVTDDPVAAGRLAATGARIVPDSPQTGLNGALAHGAQRVRSARPQAPVVALNADLPALRAVDLGRVLADAASGPRSFLADAQGVGTTLLAAGPGVALDPAFGGASRARHLATGAREIILGGVDSVRRDVDTWGDLQSALALGVGPHTAAAVAQLRSRPPAPADRSGAGDGIAG